VTFENKKTSEVFEVNFADISSAKLLFTDEMFRSALNKDKLKEEE
jgi:hypothetical protein